MSFIGTYRLIQEPNVKLIGKKLSYFGKLQLVGASKSYFYFYLQNQYTVTKRELIQAKINAYKQWLLILTRGDFDEKSLGLPNGTSLKDEIDRVLDLMIELREELKNLDKNQ